MSSSAPLSADEIRELGRKYGSWAAAARATNHSVSKLKTRASLFGIRIADVAVETDPKAQVTSEDPAEWGDIRALLKSRGLSPDDYLITRVRVNEWADQRQLRVDLQPLEGIVVPARTDGWKAPKPKKRQAKDGELVAFLTDQHCPFIDQGLHRIVCQWLRDEQPARIYLLGDVLDFDSISRWQPNPEHTASVQECINSAYDVLRAYREAAPNAEMVMLAGNHEDRLRNSIIKHLGALYGLRQADDGVEVFSLEHLLRLDELHIEFIRSEAGSYDHASIRCTDELQAIHGWVSRKGSAASAAATLDHMRVSTAQGHTHRAGLHYKTVWDIDNRERTLVAAEIPTLAEIRNGLSHAPRPDWQQGFGTATCYRDGLFSIELAIYVKNSDTDGTLLWRGKRW